MEQQQKPRMTDIMAAYQVLGALINSNLAQSGHIHSFTLQDNRVSYSNGVESVGVVVTTRNFMDIRRDAVALSVGAKVRSRSVHRREAHGWQQSERAPIGMEGIVVAIDRSEPAEMCLKVEFPSIKDWFFFAAEELEVIEPAPET
jgi:hypothetical protein